MRTAFIEALTDMAMRDPRVTLIVGDLGFGVVQEFARQFPKQFLNVGVAEQNMTGVAAGMALSGRVVFTYSIANFPTLRPLEQLRNDVCYHQANVVTVAVGGGLAYGSLGMSHHATEDLAVMRSLPGRFAILLVIPACTLDLGGDDGGGDDDRPPMTDPPPDPMTDATRVIGTNPSINAQAPDWATVWINYPSIDCDRVDTYGAELAVRVDVAYERMLAETGLVPASPEPFVQGWLALARESPDHLWRVTDWVPDGEPQPACYVW